MEALSEISTLTLIEQLACSKNAQELIIKLKLHLAPVVKLSEVYVFSIKDKQVIDLVEDKVIAKGFDTKEDSALFDLFTNVVGELAIADLPICFKQQMIRLGKDKVYYVAVNFASHKGVFFLKHTIDFPLSIDKRAYLMSLLTVFRLSLIQLDQQYQLIELIKERTGALMQSQSRFQTFAELASDWFWETDETITFTYLSLHEGDKKYKKFSNFLTKTPLDVRSDFERTQHKKWEYFFHLIKQRKEIHDFEFEAIDQQGDTVWISISGQAKFDEDAHFIGYFGISKDISFTKQREKDLQLAKEKSENANQAKSHFLAVMSHEIRTPMNAILGILELLEDSQPTAKQTELIDFMRGSAHLLQGVITDTLDFAKIESGTLMLQESTINLHKLIKNLVQQFETQALKKGIHFKYVLGNGVPEHIISDGVRLSQILLNLLGNAFKFTLQGEVSLSVNCSDTELIFRIADTGVGIDASAINSLFEPFSQLHDKQVGRQQGVGLGLSITKRLLELMNGTIECESRVGLGTSFNITLPTKLPLSTKDSDIDISEKRTEQGLSILVAEDNQANQFIIKAILEKRNHRITLVENGEQALDALKVNSYDLVLMDMVMPVMDGVTAAREIRKRYGDTAPPIIALTANAGLADKTKCLNAGMRDVLTKPLNSQLLDKRINELVNKN